MEEADKDWMMIRMLSGWVFLLVLAHPGSPGQKAVKRLLLLLLQSLYLVKICIDLLSGHRIIGVLIWGGRVSQEFLAPLSGKTACQTPKVLEVQECAWGPLYHLAKFGGAWTSIFGFLPAVLRTAQRTSV